MSWDTGDPAFMAAVVGAMIGAVLLCIGMDMRRLPLGRIKYVPWTMLTLLFMGGTLFSVRLLLQDLLHG